MWEYFGYKLSDAEQKEVEERRKTKTEVTTSHD